MAKSSEVEDNATLNSEIIPKKIDKENRSQTISVYDQIRPKNEGSFMSTVREWEKMAGFKTPIVWINTIAISLAHALVLVSVYFLIIDGRYYPKWQTIVFQCLSIVLTTFGIGAGAHRLWSHRAYKAKLPLQIILVIGYTMAGMNDLYQWVRDHRVHHKFSETSADPHDANRGFFFAHVGWLMTKKHPDVIREGKQVDMSDIDNNPLIQFHLKYFQVLRLFFCLILPVVIPAVFWDERVSVAFFAQVLKYMAMLHGTWSVNSFAHLYGNRPYNSKIMPRENWVVSFFVLGEGWHNYHHTFPWDYKAAELAFPFNGTTNLLDLFAKIGWAYELRVAPPSLIEKVAKTKGDLSYHKE
ncbi:stearoyl-CoA desaturase 5-like isoform X1 [Ostrinia nubilalis]|uniref:stearoyl-CoA desaturase 5-like isoform X1 n=1 Tax=Ostrinia nubilalis TaxID=29057 RepID=UPI003082444B